MKALTIYMCMCILLLTYQNLSGAMAAPSVKVAALRRVNPPGEPDQRVRFVRENRLQQRRPQVKNPLHAKKRQWWEYTKEHTSLPAPIGIGKFRQHEQQQSQGRSEPGASAGAQGHGGGVQAGVAPGVGTAQADSKEE